MGHGGQACHALCKRSRFGDTAQQFTTWQTVTHNTHHRSREHNTSNKTKTKIKIAPIFRQIWDSLGANVPKILVLSRGDRHSGGSKSGRCRQRDSRKSDRCKNWNFRECNDPDCPRDHVCFTCGSYNHKAEDCPQRYDQVPL